jgi:hypothetical protein
MLEEQSSDLIQGKVVIVTLAAVNILHDAFIKPAIAYHHSMRDAHQFGIGKLCAGSYVFTIIQQYFHSLSR